MNKQEQDYNAGYRQAVEDIEEILYNARHKGGADAEANIYDAVSTAQCADLGSYCREYRDGYHDALQKLYNIFKVNQPHCGPDTYERGYKQALTDIVQSEDNSIMIRNTEVLSGSIVMDCFQLIPYRFEFAKSGSISAQDIEIFDKAFGYNVVATEEEADGNFTVLTADDAAADISENTDAYTGKVFQIQE